MEDRDIIKLYFSRSDAAIAETDKKYGKYLYTVAYNITASPEDSEEAVSDTYISAWRAIPPTIPQALKHFLSRITRNEALNRCRYSSALKRAGEYVELTKELEGCLPDSVSLEETVEARQLGRLINGFLENMDSLECRIFIQRYYYATPVKEIAAKYALPERRVKYILSKRRAQLKKYLEGEGVTV